MWQYITLSILVFGSLIFSVKAIGKQPEYKVITSGSRLMCLFIWPIMAYIEYGFFKSGGQFVGMVLFYISLLTSSLHFIRMMVERGCYTDTSAATAVRLLVTLAIIQWYAWTYII